MFTIAESADAEQNGVSCRTLAIAIAADALLILIACADDDAVASLLNFRGTLVGRSMHVACRETKVYRPEFENYI